MRYLCVILLCFAVAGCGPSKADMIAEVRAKLELAESDLTANEEWFEEFGENPPSNDPERLKTWETMRELLQESQDEVAAAKQELRALVDD